MLLPTTTKRQLQKEADKLMEANIIELALDIIEKLDESYYISIVDLKIGFYSKLKWI
jgi:hypothetical protein